MGKGGKKKKGSKPNAGKEKGRSKDSLKKNLKKSNDLEEKKVAVSFKKLYQKYEEEEINKLSFNDLKIKASHFDLNPSLNFKLLSLLKNNYKLEYDKYITKYKYTLNYDDAKKLNCFKDKEKDILNESSFYKFDIKEIKSLSKVKLFNYLFYIMNLKFNEKQYEENYIDIAKKIEEKIWSYTNDVDLIFKVPNNFGNYELQYYTYLGLFIDYYSKKIKSVFDEDENEINNTDNQINESELKDIFFDWDSNPCGKEENIDITKFKQRKRELKQSIDNYISENKKNNENVQIMEIEKEEDNNKKNQEKKLQKINKGKAEIIKNDDNENWKKYTKFHKIHVCKLKKYKNELFYLFKEEDDNKIIKNIEFIYYSLLFTADKSLNLYDSYVNCLSNDPKMKNENYKERYNCYVKAKSKKFIKSEELVYYNLDEDFDDRMDNPFSNTAKFYQYPIILKKNIFQVNEYIFQLFKKYLKKIYKSDLLQEIFYSTPEFEDFKYPLLDDEILEEMIDNTVFLPFNHEALHGYTQKQFAKVYIAVNLSKDNFLKKDLSKIIIEISLILNTLLHEQFKHYIKGLLFYNAFRFKLTKRLYSDLSDYKDDNFYLDNIRKKYTKNKKEQFTAVIDGGHRAEIYLYGNILNRLYFGEALKMYDISTWTLSVLEHLDQFNENNKSISEIKQLSIEEINKNEKIDDFMKQIFIQFNKFYKCNDEIILNYTTSAERSNDISDNIPDDELIFDYNVGVEIDRIKFPDTETIEVLFNKYKQ